MLYLSIPGSQEITENNEVVTHKATTLQLEHSLVSLSRWEALHKKAFLDPNYKLTFPESIDYIRCMTITQNVDPSAYDRLTQADVDRVNAYINDTMTATRVNRRAPEGAAPRREVYTSEIIYAMMIENGIPSEYQKWHLNRLMTLIEVCGSRRNPPKPMSRKELSRRNAELNAARRKKLGTRG